MLDWLIKTFSPKVEKTLRKLGAERVCALGSKFGGLLWLLLRSRRRYAIEAVLKHLELKGPDAEKQAADIARRSFQHNGRSFAELILAPDVTHRFMEERIEIVNPEIWDRLKNYPGPGIGVTAHLGAWEILSGIMGTDIPNKDRAIVVRRQRSEALYSRIEALRSATGATMLPHKNVAPKVLRLLKKNGLVACLVDHNTRLDDAVFLPFLNETAAVNVGPALLAVRAGAAIWPIFLIQRENGKYQYYLEEPLITSDMPGTREEKILAAAQYYTRAVEKYVKMFPDQWMWMHKRWKTRPPDELKS
ncbi:MAG: lysophospholipid acyltransferase family protein [Desulfovibrionaceae bacterium]|nr:lysophospholipid acyltransferase family protein [Desulfovibrionaceae bacterium]